MKFKLETGQHFIRRLETWHKVFAWLPKRVTGDNEYRWLEYVERKGLWNQHLPGVCFWEYRAIDQGDSSPTTGSNVVPIPIIRIPGE